MGQALQAEDVPSLKETVVTRCSADQDCQRPGLKGFCQNPGQPNASCVFKELPAVSLSVIVPDDCRACNSQPVIERLKNLLSGLTVRTLSTASPEAKERIRTFKVEMLPAYILGKEAAADENFSQINQMFDHSGDFYYLRPEFSGISYFWGREHKPNHLDLFFGITHHDSVGLLKIAREILSEPDRKVSLDLQLVAKQDAETKEFISPGGQREVNEGILFACVDKYAPQKSWDYLECRVADPASLWWQDCLAQNKIDAKKVETCARGQEGRELFAAKIKLAQELNIFYPSLFLLDNVEIFGVTPDAGKQEVLKVIHQKKDAQ